VHPESLLAQAFIYLAAAVVSVPIATRLGLGAVLGYLLAGVAIGPAALGLIGTEGHDVLHFAELGVVMMLFVIGLELAPARLWAMRNTLLGLGGMQVLGTAVLIGAVALVAGLDWRGSIATGLILALSSTAIVLQSLSERDLMKTEAGERAFAVLLFQDLAVIPILAILPLLATTMATTSGQDGGWLTTLPAWGQTLVTFGAIATIVLGGQYLSSPLFRVLARAGVHEMLTAAALLLVVGIALLMGAVGLSPALGTFVAGVVLAGSEYRHELESDLEPFKALLLGLFFIAVGASIDFGLIGGAVGTVSVLVVTLVVLKLLVLYVLGVVFKMDLDQRLLFALALAQGGEFCFVLLSFAAGNDVLPRATADLLVAVVALSMALTPLLLVFWDRVVRPHFGTTERPPREPDVVDRESAVIIAGFAVFGSIVGRFLVANRVPTTVLDVDSDQVDALRRLGLEVYYGDASRLDLLRAAGAERARLLILAIGDRERTLEIVRAVQQHFPNLTILARAHSRQEAFDLLDAGVEHVYRESVDTSLRMGVDVLRLLGEHPYEAHRAAQLFRRHDERALRTLAPLRRQDQGLFQSASKQSIQDLESLLADEVKPRALPRDGAWDTTEMRAEVASSSGEPSGDEDQEPR